MKTSPCRQNRGKPVIFVPLIAGACACLGVFGCERPLQPGSPADIHRSLIDSVEREIADLPDSGVAITPTQPPAEVEEALAGRRDELDTMAGPGSYGSSPLAIGSSLIGAEQGLVEVNLQQAIESAVRNNLSLQIAQVQPAIARAGVARAQAAFDAVFFASAGHTRTDEPSIVPVLGGIPLGAAATVRDDSRVEAGVRQPLQTGGELSVSTEVTRGNNMTPGFAAAPDPAYTSRITLGLSQPLLRGFGTTTNTAQIRLAENADRRAISDLPQQHAHAGG